MIQRNEMVVLLDFLRECFIKRPLVFPACFLIVVVNIFVYLCFNPVGFSCHDSVGYVRSSDYKLDGSATYEIKIGKSRVIYRPRDSELLNVGDSVVINGVVKVPDPPTNPGEFDYSRYLKSRGITGVLYADSIVVIGSTGCGFVDWINKSCFIIRCYVVGLFDKSDQGLASAVFMGDKSLVDDSIIRNFKLSNCSHLLAVSGTHFSGFLMIVSAFLSEMRFKKRNCVPVYILFCVLLGCFTGWSESVTRASIMSSCAYASRDYLSGMSLAAIVMILANPFSCMSSGFQMSFMAALFIRMFGGRISEMLKFFSFPKIVISMLAPMMSATLGMMPFWINNTYYFSCIHIFVQLIASFIASVACMFFIPSVVFGLPHACSILLKLLLILTKWCSKFSIDGSSSRTISSFALYSLFFLLIVFLMPKSLMRRILLLPAICVVVVSSSISVRDYLNRPEFIVVFPDVGQGDCCLIICDGKSVMVDGGITSEGQYALMDVLDYYGINSIDVAIATHMDEDHIGGLIYLDSAGRIDSLLTCYDLTCRDEIFINESVYLECLWPREVIDGGNEDSVILMLRSPGLSMLLTGDAGFETETVLIDSFDLNCDVLKVGHHGSKYSTSSALLSSCTPEVSIISVGRNNSYGHPSSATIDRLSHSGSTVYRTDQSGQIVIKVYESYYYVEEYLE
ncbi:MAG: DNA internalization-related competence protein ComEC/Rec2 [Saccharofermentans sp.]|nr:DNA internalization-related competence protein ComEC/Rec2 [Saccharofermentans sp.]